MKILCGDHFPNFPVSTYQEQMTDTHSLLRGSSLTVFWVLRYIGCPSCRYDLHMMAQRYEELQKLNAQVAVVLQSVPETVKEYYDTVQPPFEIICDPAMKLYEQMEILPATSRETYLPTDKEALARYEEKKLLRQELGFTHGAYEGEELQLPAVFLVRQDTEVLYSHYAQNNMDMPSCEELIELCRQFSAD